LLHGLDSRLHHETGMPILVSKNPLYSVVLGSGRCLEEFEQILLSTQQT
jgi:rod shape-determining protein MreB